MKKLKTALLVPAVVLSLLFGYMQSGTEAARGQEETNSTLGQKFDDSSITAQIKTTYLFNPHLNASRINVNTSNREVTLEGVVKTGIQKDLAGEIAKNVHGVSSVHNELQVSDGAVRNPDEVDRTFTQAVLDATTTASVKTALALTKDVKATDINVSTRWGTVTLEGRVATRTERNRAEHVARDTDGVKDVDNKIRVRS